MGTQFFVDETKAKGYVVVPVACPDAALSVSRRAFAKLVLPGQRALHMKNESARRRSQIAGAVCDLRHVGVRAWVLDAGRGPESELSRRERALRALVVRAAPEGAAHLILDLDETLVARDARALSAAVREARAPSVTYSHQSLRAQPLLALPDVIAWCWARGGDWRRRVGPIVNDARTV
ncbi:MULTISPECIES: hypothetical protein [Aeromicrobium]|uniref:hypothetical protein n=1 Tax=Aeromicrobium TaxID=2040 RepID=UPI00257F890B|nr:MULTISPECIES: hypothetical protein [Aeromicrobium]